MGAGSQPAGPRLLARVREAGGARSVLRVLKARQTAGQGRRLDLQRPGVGSKVARAGGMEARGSPGAGEG